MSMKGAARIKYNLPLTSMIRFPLSLLGSEQIVDKQSTRSRLHSQVFNPPSYTPGTRSEGLSTKSRPGCSVEVSVSQVSDISWYRASYRSRLSKVMLPRLFFTFGFGALSSVVVEGVGSSCFRVSVAGLRCTSQVSGTTSGEQDRAGGRDLAWLSSRPRVLVSAIVLQRVYNYFRTYQLVYLQLSCTCKFFVHIVSSLCVGQRLRFVDF